jgi:hypothetical protein
MKIGKMLLPFASSSRVLLCFGDADADVDVDAAVAYYSLLLLHDELVPSPLFGDIWNHKNSDSDSVGSGIDDDYSDDYYYYCYYYYSFVTMVENELS